MSSLTLGQKSLVELLLIFAGQLKNHVLHRLKRVLLVVNNQLDIDKEEQANDEQAVESVDHASVGENAAQLLCLQCSLQDCKKERSERRNQGNEASDPKQMDLDWRSLEHKVAKRTQLPMVHFSFEKFARCVNQHGGVIKGLCAQFDGAHVEPEVVEHRVCDLNFIRVCEGLTKR